MGQDNSFSVRSRLLSSLEWKLVNVDQVKGVQFGIVTSHNKRYFYQLLEEKLAKHQHCSSFLPSPTF